MIHGGRRPPCTGYAKAKLLVWLGTGENLEGQDWHAGWGGRKYIHTAFLFYDSFRIVYYRVKKKGMAAFSSCFA